MKKRAITQLLIAGVVSGILGIVLLASAVGADAKGAMVLRSPAPGILGFIFLVVGGCCLLLTLSLAVWHDKGGGE